MEALDAAVKFAVERGDDALMRDVQRAYVLSRRVTVDQWNAAVRRAHGLPEAPKGTGDYLTDAFSELGVPSCQRCKDLAARMNAWGLAECERRRPEILAELLAREKEVGWLQWAKVAARAALRGYASMDSILSESFRRARLQEEGGQTATITPQPRTHRPGAIAADASDV